MKIPFFEIFNIFANNVTKCPTCQGTISIHSSHMNKSKTNKPWSNPIDLVRFVKGILAEARKWGQPCLGIEYACANEMTEHALKKVHLGARGARNLCILVFSACSQCCSLSSQCVLKYHLTLSHILCPKFSPSNLYSWLKGYTLHPHIKIAILGSLPSFNFLLGDWRHPKKDRMWLGVVLHGCKLGLG